MKAMINFLRVAVAALMVVVGIVSIAQYFLTGDLAAKIVFFVMMGSFAAALLIIIDTIRYGGGRFGLSTLMLIVMLFALSFGALAVVIHTPSLLSK
jgi:hypothetical protein